MIKHRYHFSIALSAFLHIGLIFILLVVIEPTQSLSSGAEITAPTFTIALTPASQPSIEQAKPQQTQVEKTQVPIISDVAVPEIIETAEIIVATKKQETKKSYPTPVKPVVKTPQLTEKKHQPNRQENKETTAQDKPLLTGKARTFSAAAAPTHQQITKAADNRDEGLMDAYKQKIRQEVERNKQYPRRARTMKVMGKVVVQFDLQNDGKIVSPRIIQSSDNSLLDQAAIDAVNRSNSVGSPPKNFPTSLTLTIEFITQ